MADQRDFLAQLPSGRLLPKETELRDTLTRAAILATELIPKHVPMQDWVECRMPGEIQLGFDANFRVTLTRSEVVVGEGLTAAATRAGSGDPGRGANQFLRGLPDDDFLPEEGRLRDALLESLTMTPAPLGRIAAHPRIVGITRDFLPPNVQLAEWIEWRIGAEVSVSTDEQGRHLVRSLGGSQSEAPAAAGPAPAAEVLPHDFFAALPVDSYTRAEEGLRDALFDIFAAWQSPELATLVHLSVDKAVKQAKSTFMPQSVSLREWIDRRMGAEIELRKDARDKMVVDLTPAALALVKKRYATRSFEQKPKVQQKVEQKAAPTEEVHDTFYASLPPKLTRLEEDLRDKLMEFLEAWEKSHPDGPMPFLSAAGSHPGVAAAKTALLPKGLSFKEWLDRRCKGVTSRKCPNGQFSISLKAREGVGTAGRAPDRNRKPTNAGEQEEDEDALESRREAFFNALPQDDFLPAERDFRECVLDYVERAPTDQGAPLLHKFINGPKAMAGRKALLPNGCGVSVQQWIDRRMGGEIEMRTISPGTTFFALRGKLDSYDEPASGQQAKRRRM